MIAAASLRIWRGQRVRAEYSGTPQVRPTPDEISSGPPRRPVYRSSGQCISMCVYLMCTPGPIQPAGDDWYHQIGDPWASHGHIQREAAVIPVTTAAAVR